MAYVPDPNDATEPLETRPAGSAAEEFRALKAVVAALVVAAAASAAPRQTIASAALDTSGNNAALSAGAGLRVSLSATAEPYQLSFASGFNTGKAIDSYESIAANNADIIGADLPLSNTSYLYRNYGTGYGSCLVPPQYGQAFDKTSGALLNFEGANGSVVFVDDFGNTWTAAGNAAITTAQFKYGTASLALDGTGDYITTSDILSLGDDSWEISCWFRINALPTAGNASCLISYTNAAGFGITLQLSNVAGTTKLQTSISSNGTSNNVQNASNGTNTVWTLNQWNKVRLVFDALGGTYRSYLSLNGALETQDNTVASTAKVNAGTLFRFGVNFAGGSGFNGWIDACRFVQCATNTSPEVPAAVAPAITDYPYHFFSIPQMKMYEVTAASSGAGVLPTLTARTRLFLGEADTSAVAVTAVRNYAVRGQYDSDWGTNTAVGTAKTWTHNIGLKPEHVDFEIYFKGQVTTATFPTGEVYPIKLMDYVGVAGRGQGGWSSGRNAMAYRAEAALEVVGSLANGSVTATNVTIRLRARRGW